MRNVLFVASLLVLAAVTPAAGQGSVGDVVPDRAIRVTIGGSIDLNLVARNEKFFDAAFALPAPGVFDDGGTPGGSGGDVFLDPIIRLQLGVQLKEGVTAVVELETPYSNLGDAGGLNTGAPSGSSRTLDVEQVFVRWEGAFTPELTLQVGVQDFAHDFSGTETNFFVDVAHSENPFDGYAANGFPVSSTWMIGTQEAAGLFAGYDAGDVDLDLFYFTIGEGLRDSSDISLYGVSMQTDSGPDTAQPWAIGAGLYVLENGSSSQLYTFGGGGSTTIMDGALKLYGEAYGQFGNYDDAAGISQRDAFALFGGARFSINENDYKPYFDLSYWEVSGDTDGTDGSNDNFVSLEGNNDTLIVEDGRYGFDIDTNYRAIKARFGFTPQPYTKLRVELLYAYFELQDAASGADSKIGDEVDLAIQFFATEYLTFRLATGWLFDGHALGIRDDANSSRIEAQVRF